MLFIAIQNNKKEKTNTNIMSHCEQKKRQDGERDCSIDHLYAQKLNNAAASCIDSGQHDKAVFFLVKALRLSPTTKTYSADQDDIRACPSYCLLDECIGYSEERASLHQYAERDPKCGPETKKQKIETKTRCAAPLEGFSVSEDVNEADGSIGYTHKRPILVTPTIINEGRIMGPTLSLIITFNLALASHLKLIEAVASEDGRTCKSIATREMIGKVLRLYELAYQWEGNFCQRQHGSNDETNTCSCNEKQEIRKQKHHQDATTSTSLPRQNDSESDSTTNRDETYSSLRFDMIVCNNLSQIHRMAQNHAKEEKCLQHLLSILMFVIDWQRERVNSGDEDANNDTSEQQQQQQVEASSSEETNTSLAVQNNNYATIQETPSPLEVVEEQEQQQQQHQERRSGKRKRCYMNSDGFWRNISPFLLKNDCAEAA